MKLLFVVHRYYPYPGGSEYYVRNMAEEALHRGHDVTVLAHENQGDQNSVRVTNDHNILIREKWDLIIVHGADANSQNVVHMNVNSIPSPVLYLIIKPSTSAIAQAGMNGARYLGYSTSFDLAHIKRFGLEEKARRVRHGICPLNSTGMLRSDRENRERAGFGDDETIFVSGGGFYPNKGMTALAEAWKKVEDPEYFKYKLHLYGYGPGDIPETTDKVIVHQNASLSDFKAALSGCDCYIMNSYEEGFGLVLLEAMIQNKPWVARYIAGAYDLRQQGFGEVYNTEAKLIDIINSERWIQSWKLQMGAQFVIRNHLIRHTVDDIEDILNNG